MPYIFFILIIIVIYFLKITGNLFYEDYEANIQIILSGAATNHHPINHLYFSAHYPFADLIYVPLYRWTQGQIPIYEIFMYLYMSIAGSILLNTIYNKIKFSNRIIQYTSFTLFATSFLFLVINLHHTIVAALLITASFLLIIQSKNNNDNTSYSSKALILPIILFILGFITRYQIGLLYAGFFIISSFIIPLSNKIQKRYTLIITLLTLLIYTSILINRNQSNDFVEEMDFIIGYQIGRENFVPLSDMKSLEDSLKYQAINDYISDPLYIPIDYYVSILKSNPILSVKLEFIERAFSILFEYIEKEKHWVLIYLMILGLTLSSNINNKNKIYRLILFNIFFWMTNFAIIYLIRMESRLFKPLIFTVISINFCFLNPLLKLKKDKIISCLIISIVIAIVFIKMERKHTQINNLNTTINKDFTQNVIEKSNKNIIIPGFNISNTFRSNIYPFEKPNFSLSNSTVYHLDTDVAFWQKTYNNWVASNCNCNTDDLASFYQYLQKNEGIIVSEDERIVILKKYLSEFRNLSINFVPYDSIIHNNEYIYLYKIQ